MKFELTTNTKVAFDKTLFQIRALIDFSHVKAGDLGGWVEKVNNLSQSGDAWVFGDAWVYGDARVSGDAQVFGDTQVSGDAWVFGDAQVFGDARVSGDARVFGDAEKTPINITGLYYPITITDSHIKIGCEFHTTREWNDFTDAEIHSMDNGNACDFWGVHKNTILNLAKYHQE